MTKRITAIVAALTLIGLVSAFWGKQHISSFSDRPIALAAETVYELKPGSSFTKLAEDLENNSIVDDAFQLRIYARLSKNAQRVKSGEYRIVPGISHKQLIELFVSGKVLQRQLTLVEGLRAQDYLKELAANTDVVQTLDGQSTADIATILGIPGAKLEGWIYPDTYSYTKSTRDIDLLKRAYKTMTQVLQDEWAKREPNLPFKTPYDALILASIVEKETAAIEERAEIAGVFVRRLNKNMRLQTDPTVIYGLGASYNGNITRADLKAKTPYNTYRIVGLTPTPIANPGRAAIHAVLHPAPGKALYFVAKGNGRHQFSATYAEHVRAVQRFQRSKRRKDYRSVPQSTSAK
ncbi:MAG: endolytic transglycosylase MltG [Motiliproteus sp.]